MDERERRERLEARKRRIAKDGYRRIGNTAPPRRKKTTSKNKRKINNLKINTLKAIAVLVGLTLVDDVPEIVHKYEEVTGHYYDASMTENKQMYSAFNLVYSDENGYGVAEQVASILDELGREANLVQLPAPGSRYNLNNAYDSDYYVHIDGTPIRGGFRTEEMATAFMDYGLENPVFLSSGISPFSRKPTNLSWFLETVNGEYPGETVGIRSTMSEKDKETAAKAIVSGLFKREAGDKYKKFDIDKELEKARIEKMANDAIKTR